MKVNDPDYYEWEMHIFFDDAMVLTSSNDECVPNQFVCQLVSLIRTESLKWHGNSNAVRAPQMCLTPYGSRLIWNLPGGTKITCHLKDRNKIRHKKRWSQCMYMYYFLGHQIVAKEELNEKEKDIQAQNTYLLALDGDMSFKPEAVIKLVQLMRQNSKLGACCGRIHPTGQGFIQWYQKFEYAICHWLQKSTEHVMGGVLCSPGCFSLYRGRAIMDNNIMQTYTTLPTQAKYFQFIYAVI